MKKDIKHIAFGINNAHSKYVRVVIRSIAKNNKNSSITIHIINDGISKSNKKKFYEEISRYNNLKIKFYKIDSTKFEGIVTREWHVSTWYRILLPLILDNNINKILYLDSDTLVNGSLDTLFDVDLDEYSIAAVSDLIYYQESNLKRLPMIKNGTYICAGVMLMNLEYWRQHNLSEKIFTFAREIPELLIFPDQDAINIVCDGKIKLLPYEYGYVLDFQNKKHSIIFHYGYLKPWKFADNSPFFHIWEKYNNTLLDPINLIIPKCKVTLKTYIYKLMTSLGLKR